MATPDWNTLSDVDLTQYQRNLADTGVAQARFNRPTTHGPFGSSTVDANGNISQSFSGQFGALNNNLMGQAAYVAANPMDWGQFGTLGTGQDAGKQTANAAYSQSLSRLNPFWQKSQKNLNTSLLQSGMGDSTAADTTQGEFGRARNDAYTGAMSNAIGAGMQAQQQAFGGNLASRQNNVSNALRGQMQPFEDLYGMQGFMTQPQVGRDNSMMVRDSAFNQMAPVTAQADHERATTDHLMGRQPGVFDGATGVKRRAAWDSVDPRQRDLATQLFGHVNIDSEYKP